jgi:hypothetical protein
MTEPHDDRSQARREAAALLGVDIEHLSPADGLRVDMVSALRLVIDSEQATVLDGGQSDLGKLNVAVQSLIALLPGASLPEPESNREDPREHMWRTYLEMRRRGELADSYRSPQQRLEAARAKVAEIEAELAALAPPPDEPSGTPPAPAAPAPDNVVRLSRPPAAPVFGDLVSVVSDPSADPRNYVEPTGEIRTTPRGRGQDWGPV